MELDHHSGEPTARQRMLARNVIAQNPVIFNTPDECIDCEDLRFTQEDIAMDAVLFNKSLSSAVQVLCFFKDECSGAARSSDGKWLSCGSQITPAG